MGGGRSRHDGYPFEIIEVFFQTRINYGTRSDGQAVYQGWAPADALESDPVWIIKKNYYDTSNQMVGSVFAGTSTIGDATPKWKWSDLLAASLTFPSVTGGS